jgi:hypothetical protein
MDSAVDAGCLSGGTIGKTKQCLGFIKGLYMWSLSDITDRAFETKSHDQSSILCRELS